MKRKITYDDCVKANLLENMHFSDRERKCSNCEDYLNNLCKGENYVKRKEIMDCMMEKALQTEIITNLE